MDEQTPQPPIPQQPVPQRPVPEPSHAAVASDPGGLSIDPDRLRRLSPSLFGLSGLLPANVARRTSLTRHVRIGDTRAAVVVAVEPLVVAAYSDDFDAVVLLRFDPGPTDLDLQVGTRLLTVNTFGNDGPVAPDIARGPLASTGWSHVHPVIADFVCPRSELDRVERRKQAIREDEWQRTAFLGRQYLATRPGQLRDGAPHLARRPARNPAAR